MEAQKEAQNTVEKQPNIIIMYHQFCSDGWCAAAIASLYLSKYFRQRPPNLSKNIYMPVFAGKTDAAVDQLIAEQSSKSLVLSYDLNFTYWGAKKLLNYFPTAKIYDHHDTTEECFKRPISESFDEFTKTQLMFKDRLIYDKTISGAMLAWNSLFPEHKAPLLVQYVQDRDLWEWKLPNSREINTGLSEVLTTSPNDGSATNGVKLSYEESTTRALNEWSQYLLTDTWLEDARVNGEMILKIQNRSIKRMYRDGAMHLIADYTSGQKVVYKVYVCNTSMYISELGEYIYLLEDDTEERAAKKASYASIASGVVSEMPETTKTTEKKYKYDYALMWRYDQQRSVVCASMRARKEHQVNLATIAAQFKYKDAKGKECKGGGHKPAAGFEMGLTEFMNYIGKPV